MALRPIEKPEDLHDYLQAAIALEHATIPPYLTALYTIPPGTNSDAFHIIRVVAVEEMLHLTLAANMLNAIGGQPDLTRPGFVPTYPTYLQNGEHDFKVSLQRFSRTAIDNFMQIERPHGPPEGPEEKIVGRQVNYVLPPVKLADGTEMHFPTIGAFYAEIRRGMTELHDKGELTFVDDHSKQIGPEYYYSGGGEVIPVVDLVSAQQAIRLISEQGEGHGADIFDYEYELSHYYRFQQLDLGKYYLVGDEADHPQGAAIEVDWTAAYPVMTNARLSAYEEGSQVRAAAEEFNASYGMFLAKLTRAFNGEPGLLLDAVGDMFRIREAAYRLVRNPIAGDTGENAAPTFEITGA